MEVRTYFEWQTHGRQVVRGARHVAWSSSGEALFRLEQTVEPHPMVIFFGKAWEQEKGLSQ